MTTKEELHQAVIAWATVEVCGPGDAEAWRAWNEAWENAPDEAKRDVIVRLAAKLAVPV